MHGLTPWSHAAVLALMGAALVQVVGVVVQRRLVNGGHPHWALIARKVVSYIGGGVLVLLIARTSGVDIRALAATAGVASIAIGFAAQTSLSNLIAGLFLLLDRPFSVGDTVEIEGRVGVIREISLMSTLMRTFNGILVRWPNEVVLKSTILNLTHFPARRVDVPITVRLDADPARCRRLLSRVLSDLDAALIEPAPEVLTVGFTDGGIALEVRVWVPQSEFLTGRTATVEAVHRAFRDAGIDASIPRMHLVA